VVKWEWEGTDRKTVGDDVSVVKWEWEGTDRKTVGDDV
jgi:hypothetical protein